jgi:hypothetical protein
MNSIFSVSVLCSVVVMSACQKRNFGEGSVNSVAETGGVVAIGDLSAYTSSASASGFLTNQRKEIREVTSCAILVEKNTGAEHQFRVVFLNDKEVIGGHAGRFNAQDITHGGRYVETSEYDLWFMLDDKPSVQAYYLKDRPSFFGKVSFDVKCFFTKDENIGSVFKDFIRTNHNE